jgi:hypothetical protein
MVYVQLTNIRFGEGIVLIPKFRGIVIAEIQSNLKTIATGVRIKIASWKGRFGCRSSSAMTTFLFSP